MQTIQQVLQSAVIQLRPLLGDQKQAWFEAELLLAHILKMPRIELVTSLQRVTNAKIGRFNTLLKRRLRKEPIAYLLGHAPFFGQDFLVDQRVLIPRPESEWLIERSLELIGSDPALVWDVGTGSGIIALSIKRLHPTSQVIASDISAGALTVAKRNAKQLATPDIRFVKGSLLTPAIKKDLFKTQKKHILIVANLPYLPKQDRSKMQTQVTKYEPSSALFANDHGSALIKQLLSQVASTLLSIRQPLTILLELDPPQSKPLIRFSQSLFPTATVNSFRDFNQKNRFLQISIPSSTAPIQRTRGHRS